MAHEIEDYQLRTTCENRTRQISLVPVQASWHNLHHTQKEDAQYRQFLLRRQVQLPDEWNRYRQYQDIQHNIRVHLRKVHGNGVDAFGITANTRRVDKSFGYGKAFE